MKIFTLPQRRRRKLLKCSSVARFLWFLGSCVFALHFFRLADCRKIGIVAKCCRHRFYWFPPHTLTGILFHFSLRFPLRFALRLFLRRKEGSKMLLSIIIYYCGAFFRLADYIFLSFVAISERLFFASVSYFLENEREGSDRWWGLWGLLGGYWPAFDCLILARCLRVGHECRRPNLNVFWLRCAFFYFPVQRVFLA